MNTPQLVLVLATVMAGTACDTDAERTDDAFRAGPLVLMSDLSDDDALAGYYDHESDSIRFTQQARQAFSDEDITFVNAQGEQVLPSELTFDASVNFPQDEMLDVVMDGRVVGTLVRESSEWFDGLTEDEAESNFPITVVIDCLG